MGTLLNRLRKRHSEAFVGRESELRLSTAVLEGDVPVLYICGAPGVGKTALISGILQHDVASRYAIFKVDLRNIAPDPQTVLDCIAKELGIEGEGTRIIDIVDCLEDRGKNLLVFDSAESISSIEPWLRDALISELPGPSACIVASRTYPHQSWSVDPVWDAGFQIMHLGALDETECKEMISRIGIDNAPVEWLCRTSQGNPLFLKLLAKHLKLGRALGEEARSFALEELHQRIMSPVSTPLHQQALYVAAIAKRIRVELISDVVSAEEADNLFNWLKGQSYVQRDRMGLYPENLMREAILNLSELSGIDEYEKTSRQIGTHLLKWSGKEEPFKAHFRALETIYSSRYLDMVASTVDVDAIDYFQYGLAQPSQIGEITSFVKGQIQPDRFQLFCSWLNHPATDLWAVRNKNTRKIAGAFLAIDTTRLQDGDKVKDPFFEKLLLHIERNRNGRRDSVHRFVVAEGGMQSNKAVAHAMISALMLQMFSVRELHRVFGIHADPDHWTEFMKGFSFERLPELDHNDGNSNLGVFVRNFSTTPFGSVSWTFVDPTRPKRSMIDPKQFELELRELLKVLNYPASVEASPMAKMPFVLMAMEKSESAGATLRRLIVDEIEALGKHPKTERAFRAVKTTFLEADMTQEAAAETLGLPFGTYRYQLQTGIARISQKFLQRAGLFSK